VVVVVVVAAAAAAVVVRASAGGGAHVLVGEEGGTNTRATHAHPTSPRSTGFCVIWECISSSSEHLLALHVSTATATGPTAAPTAGFKSSMGA